MEIWIVTIKIEQFVARLAMRLGSLINSERLVIWGATHYPIVIEDEDDE
jgi:hypothetical protein